jgi:hypothetical protein
MVWLPLLLPTLAAAAPFRMVFKRLPKDNPVDGARRAARIDAAHRQRAMLKDEHCLIDSINTTLKTTRDVLDWGGSDQLFAKWWDEHVVDFTLSSENCKSRDFATCLEGRWRQDGVTVLRAAGHSPCKVARNLQHATHPYIYVSVGENWGAFSSHHVNRTANWNYWTDAKECGGKVVPSKHVRGMKGYGYGMKDEAALMQYHRHVRDWLDSPQLRLLLTTQRTSQIRHPKVVPLPLGVRHINVALLMSLIVGAARPQRTRWLLINNSGWQFRQAINEMVSAKFSPRLQNTYCAKKSCPLLENGPPVVYKGHTLDHKAYTDLARYPSDLEAFYKFSTYGQILTSKFVLCPPGLGPDSYRLWEVLYLGAIPIIERTQGGWDDLLVDLPVLLVDSYEEITPEFLRERYAFILGKCGTFDLRRLTKAYYLHLIRRQGTTRLGEGTTRPHATKREGSPYALRQAYGLAPVPQYLRERLPPHLRPPKMKHTGRFTRPGLRAVTKHTDLSKLTQRGEI